jgi:hypothetical protein
MENGQVFLKKVMCTDRTWDLSQVGINKRTKGYPMDDFKYTVGIERHFSEAYQ